MEKDDDKPIDERFRLAQGLEEYLEPKSQPPANTPPPFACPGYCPTCPRCREGSN